MKIGFIGAGKVGFSLGKYFAEHGLVISGYYSRNLTSSMEAADFTGTKYFTTIEEIIINSDTLFLTVPDGTIYEVYSEILKHNIRGKNLVHCSGALTSEIFSGIDLKGACGCSVHPLCAISSRLTGFQDLSKAYFTVEGKNEEEFRRLIMECGNPCEILPKENKAKYHASAVYASNLVIALYDMAAGLLQECGLSEEFSNKALLPLFYGNAASVMAKGVCEALTGPVERGDVSTIEKHLKVLSSDEEKIYRLLSAKLLSVAGRKYPERNNDKLNDLLTGKVKTD